MLKMNRGSADFTYFLFENFFLQYCSRREKEKSNSLFITEKLVHITEGQHNIALFFTM